MKTQELLAHIRVNRYGMVLLALSSPSTRRILILISHLICSYSDLAGKPCGTSKYSTYTYMLVVPRNPLKELQPGTWGKTRGKA